MLKEQWPDVVANDHYLWTPLTVINQQESYFVYVPITKCASTYLRNVMPAPEFDSRLWRFTNPKIATDVPEPACTRWFVVLRDPWSRWLSGATHWLSHQEQWRDLVDHVIDQIEMDAHTCPQTQFLTTIDISRTSFMRYQSNIGAYAWFRVQGWTLGAIAPERHNITERTDIPHKLQDRVTRAQIHRIKDYYYQDYELIRTARFV